MSDQFKEDQLKNEKNEPIEQSSLRFVGVPMLLLAAFIGFGVTYLALRTDHISMAVGDSRTNPASAATAPTDTAKTELDVAALIEKGKHVFTTTCQACHQASGSGLTGAFPPLDGSEWVSGSKKQLAAIVLHGIQGEIKVKDQTYQGSMPTFKDQLSDQDIAAVVTYVRQAWSNKSDALSVDLVKATREETKNHDTPWAGGAELQKQKWE